MHPPVYLDHNATTPIDPRVLEAMLPYFGPRFGNAASRTHAFGWEAEKAVDRARRQVAALAGVQPREIVFTSGATESNNFALRGVLEASGVTNCHVVAMTTEHRAVLDPLQRLARQGAQVTLLAPCPDGRIDLEQLRSAIRPNTRLVSVMYANNEIGVVQPVPEIGSICRERGVLFHCDAAQAFGKVSIHAKDQNIDLMSLSAHKMYGPKGVGALVVRRSSPAIPLETQMDGGGHEFGYRSGTLNVPGIVGFGAAAHLCTDEMEVENERVAALRDRLRKRLLDELDELVVNGSLDHRLAGNLNLTFVGVEAAALLIGLPDVAASTGSACSSATAGPSHVLKALGLSDEAARSSVRFGLGRFTTEEEVDFAAGRVIETVRRLRALSPLATRVSTPRRPT